VVPRRPLVTDVAGPVAVSTAKSWIEECHAVHGECYFNGNSVLPTRVIDVGGDSSAQSVRLHITDLASGERGVYTVLSYCWGGPQPVVATVASLESLKAGILISALPQTIQDAIEITRKLAFRYLWIDALCIIQDSTEDKEKEIQKMGQIYKDAALTIAASASTGVAQGFLRLDRSLDKFCAFDLDLDLTDGKRGKVFLTKHDIFEPKHPLDKRGWTLQEFLLSPRILSFSHKELFWHCQTANLRTITESNVRYNFRPMRLPPDIFKRQLLARGSSAKMGSKDRVQLWIEIVEHYTERSLTDPEDRLHALAGITSELKQLWHDECLFGLWKQTLVELLLWSPQATLETRWRLDRAPSWSWASLDCPIGFASLERADATIIQAHLASSPDPGLRKIRLRCKVLEEEQIPSDSSFARINRFWDLSSEALPSDSSLPRIIRFWDLPIEAEHDRQVRYLVLGDMRNFPDVILGLMVVREENSAPDVFRRVGYFNSQPSTMWERVTLQEITLL